MSPQELALWLQLRMLRSEGWHFRRQSPEGAYILDFVCRTAKLIVEVDGVHHASAEQCEHDRERDAWLRQRGFRVLRFWASDVQNELDGVMGAIRATLGPGDSTRSAMRDAFLAPGRDSSARHRHLVRLGLRRRD